MLKELDTYDWQEAFGYAGEPGTEADGQLGSPVQVVDVPPGSGASNAPFTREDVEEIFLLSEGENDERDWLGVFRLKDGRYAYLHAGCDYTGWDCRAGGSAVACESLVEVFAMGMTQEQRREMAERQPEICHYAMRDLLLEGLSGPGGLSS